MENPIRRTESREVYRGRVLRVREDRVVLPRGTEAIYNVVEISPGASVLPVDGDLNVHLIREYKWAVARTCLEAIGGAIEEGESALACARRELAEEGGLAAAEWIPMGVVDPFTAHVASPNHMFLARGLREVGTNREEGEVIQMVRMPLAEALERALDGGITHAASVVLVLKAARLLGL